MGTLPYYVINDPGQLTLMPLVGREMSTSQNSVMICGWGVEAGWLIPFVVACVGVWSLLVKTCRVWAFYRWVRLGIKRCTNIPFALLSLFSIETSQLSWAVSIAFLNASHSAPDLLMWGRVRYSGALDVTSFTCHCLEEPEKSLFRITSAAL